VVLLDAHAEPEVLCLEIGRKTEASLEVRDVEPIGGQAKYFGE
jgi:hypothetical protein